MLLVTDLYGGASYTHHGFRDSKQAQRALKTLQQGLLGATGNESDVPTGPLSATGERQPPSARRRRRLSGVGGGGTPEARAALRHAIHVIKDDGMEAMIEQEMCAIAPVVVMCLGHDDHSACHDCSRGMDSGFVAAITHLREGQFNKSTRANERGGIWQW